MSTRRESWYHCTYESAQRRVTGAVLAWTDDAAIAQFESAIADEHEHGTITVRRGGGRSEATALRSVTSRWARRRPRRA